MTLFVSLVVLALIDSTSVGTLLIPLWTLLEPRPRVGRFLRRRRGAVTMVSRWQSRLSTAEGSRTAMVGLGLTAAGVEVLSMVPTWPRSA